MSSGKKQFLVETDLLVDHLVNSKSEKTYLEKLLECGICFTTVINSAEIYFAVRNDEEKQAVDALMKGVKVLGFHARYSLYVDKYSEKVKCVRDALICATTDLNKLILVTNKLERYSEAGINSTTPDKIKEIN